MAVIVGVLELDGVKDAVNDRLAVGLRLGEGGPFFKLLALIMTGVSSMPEEDRGRGTVLLSSC